MRFSYAFQRKLISCWTFFECDCLWKVCRGLLVNQLLTDLAAAGGEDLSQRVNDMGVDGELAASQWRQQPCARKDNECKQWMFTAAVSRNMASRWIKHLGGRLVRRIHEPLVRIILTHFISQDGQPELFPFPNEWNCNKMGIVHLRGPRTHG